MTNIIALNPTARIAELERRYDGPIPWAERAVAFFGHPTVILLLQATARAAYFRHLAVSQWRKVICPRRRDGTYQPYMADDCRLYIREARKAEREEARLTAEVEQIRQSLCPDAAMAAE